MLTIWVFIASVVVEGMLLGAGFAILVCRSHIHQRDRLIVAWRDRAKRAKEACAYAATEFACLLAGHPEHRGTSYEVAYHKCDAIRKED